MSFLFAIKNFKSSRWPLGISPTTGRNRCKRKSQVSIRGLLAIERRNVATKERLVFCTCERGRTLSKRQDKKLEAPIPTIAHVKACATQAVLRIALVK